MKIAVVSSEATPFSKTGGLADVAGALFREYLKAGHEAYLLVPFYKKTGELFGSDIADTGMEIAIPLGKAERSCRVFTLREQKGPDSHTRTPAGNVFFIGNDDYFMRDELYGNTTGDYPDNDQRYVFFCRSVLETCKKMGLKIDAFHCNDWQTGLIPLYLKTLYRRDPFFDNARSLMTIHNIGYQGVFPPQTMDLIGLGWELFSPEGLEFYGKVNFLKAGVLNADSITTVSMTYAKEILTAESGFGLDGVLRKRADSLAGILNGVDYDYWDPSSDDFLPAAYSPKKLSGKAICKNELARRCSLTRVMEDPQTPVLCFVGRLSSQKGIDILAGAIPHVISMGANIVITGRGEGRYHSMLNSLCERFPGGIFFHQAFDESAAHLYYAGSDIFLMPSLYEPCGLGQLIALRYGTISVAHRTGGLIDTIEDGKTGFLFGDYSVESFMSGIRKALDAYADKAAWQGFVGRAMRKDFSWKKPVKAYLKLCAGSKL